MNYRGMTVLITGASVGLGESFAKKLAAQGANLVLVARSEDKLNRLAASLREAYKVQVAVMAADLSSAEGVDRLIRQVQGSDTRVDVLVNNAGFGIFENFLEVPIEKQLEQIDLNVRALVTLSHAFAPAMVAARRGGIINLSSIAGFQPLAGAEVYAATKAFVLLFSEGLSLELKKAGVKVLASCPGPVATQFYAAMNPKTKSKEMDQADPVVEQALQAFESGKTVVYPGKLLNLLSTWGARFLPRNVILKVAAGSVDKLNQH